MALNDKYELVVCCYTADQIALNRSYWNEDAVVAGGASMADKVAAFNAAMAPVYKNFMSNEAFFRGVSLRPITTPTSSATANVSLDGAGTVVQPLLPGQVSGVISFKTAFAGAGYRGRVYPGFMPSTFQSIIGKMTAAAAVALAQISAVYASGIVATTGAATSTFHLQVRHTNVAPAPPSYYNVVEILTRNRFATQRRRGQFGRQNSVPF